MIGPKLDEIKNWTLPEIQAQHDKEHAALLEFLKSPTRQQSAYVGGPKHHELTSRHYRLSAMDRYIARAALSKEVKA